jgi:predicted MPP superfamily phosphohydrolase
MILLVILILTEIFSLAVIRQRFFSSSKPAYYISLLIHIVLSLWIWILFFETSYHNSHYDDPRYVWQMMNLRGMLSAVVLPRIILIFLHFSGKLTKIKSGGYSKRYTNAGIVIMVLFMISLGMSAFRGRFNFKTEKVTINVKGLKKDLDGLKIVQISDLHMATFYHHKKVLQDVMERINSYKPDLILNTGDFVTIGWREFERNDTILAKAVSRYGNFAVLGNHDFGTYNPDYTRADRTNNVLIMNNLVESSGYTVLNDDYKIIRIGQARVALIGIVTIGRHSHMIHGNLKHAMDGIDTIKTDFKIFLSHDPNTWEKDVVGKTDINLTLSGHTHGMQMGIMTKKIRWSPARYFYPHWNGLYREGDQYQYVNRGLGVLTVPFRIWMPPEITLITLRSEPDSHN